MTKLIKTIAILTLLAASINAFSAEITCLSSSKKGNSLLRAYPIDAVGVKLALELGVLTCGGDAFQFEAKKAGHTLKVVKGTKDQVRAARAKLNK